MQQMDLLEPPPRARRTDPETSHLAAAQAGEMAKRHRSIILQVLADHGPAGKDRIAALCRLDGVAVCRRLSEMHRGGLIRPTGRTVTSTAGRLEREWVKA